MKRVIIVQFYGASRFKQQWIWIVPLRQLYIGVGTFFGQPYSVLLFCASVERSLCQPYAPLFTQADPDTHALESTNQLRPGAPNSHSAWQISQSTSKINWKWTPIQLSETECWHHSLQPFSSINESNSKVSSLLPPPLYLSLFKSIFKKIFKRLC